MSIYADLLTILQQKTAEDTLSRKLSLVPNGDKVALIQEFANTSNPLVTSYNQLVVIEDVTEESLLGFFYTPSPSEAVPEAAPAVTLEMATFDSPVL